MLGRAGVGWPCVEAAVGAGPGQLLALPCIISYVRDWLRLQRQLTHSSNVHDRLGSVRQVTLRHRAPLSPSACPAGICVRQVLWSGTPALRTATLVMKGGVPVPGDLGKTLHVQECTLLCSWRPWDGGGGSPPAAVSDLRKQPSIDQASELV